MEQKHATALRFAAAALILSLTAPFTGLYPVDQSGAWGPLTDEARAMVDPDPAELTMLYDLPEAASPAAPPDPAGEEGVLPDLLALLDRLPGSANQSPVAGL